jgi:hypothetical protein
MKRERSAVATIALVFLVAVVQAENFSGEYADRKFLNGQGVFQMSLEQGGNAVSVWFSAGYNDGHGAAPDATGSGRVNGKGGVDFKFEDSFRNVGTGTIMRSGDDVIISIKPTRVADSRCLEFYRQNVRLKRVGKK